MPISNIPIEATQKPKGHIFGTDVEKRINEVLTAIKNKPVNSEKEEEERKKFLENLIVYRSVTNPSNSYNMGRKQPEYHKARKLTMERLNDFLDAAGWTPKYFLELLLHENEKFSAEQCVSPKDTEGWAEIAWPTKEMAELAEVLDTLDEESLKRIEKFISNSYPPSYFTLFTELQTPSDDLSSNNNDLPDYVLNHLDEYEPETKVFNLSDRIFSTIRYLCGNDIYYILGKLKQIGINIDIKRLYAIRHYWLFKPKDVKKLCDAFHMSPHWVFFGPDKTPLLMKNSHAEEIMDMFSLLPQPEQVVVSKAIISAVEDTKNK